MTVQEAYRILRPPLRFGDESQIAARKFLEQVNLAKEAIRDCDADHYERVRYSEDGKGTCARWIMICECVEGFKFEHREAAAVSLVDEWRADL